MGTKQITNTMADHQEGIIESTVNYIADKAHAVGDYLGAGTEEAKHKAKEEAHSAERHVNQEVVKSSEASITDRVKAAGNVVVDGAKELKEGSAKKAEEAKREEAKQRITGTTPQDKAERAAREATGETGIIESVTNYVSDTVSAVADYFTAGAKEAEHKAKEEGHHLERKADQEVAKSSNASIGDRISAAGDAVVDGVKELKEGAAKKGEEAKKEEAKQGITG